MQRRKFMKQTAAASTAFSIVPSFVMGKEHVPPSDTLYIGAFGVGGRGAAVINGLDSSGKVKFVTLCDVDGRRAAETFKKYPKAKQYKDFRKVYENHLDEMDAIMVATPDHNHATIALPFMRAKKHAYVEKPLTHNIMEARMLTQVAKENNLVTQMGNQGASSDGSREAREMMDSGIIGEVTKIDCWTNRPVWPQGVPMPTGDHKIPKELDWDLWLGPAEKRPYHPVYVPFNWRGWWDFGTGALGDMGCHIIETPFSVLDLGYPTEAEASCTTVWSGEFTEADYHESCPPSSIVRLKFDSPEHGELELNWFDGGLKPQLPEELGEGETIGDGGGGTVFYGTKGVMVADTYSRNARLLPSKTMELFKAPDPYLKRIEGDIDGHQRNFVEACLTGGETSSNFERAGKLTEAVLMGNLAIRSYQYMKLKDGKKATDWAPYEYPGRRKIMWDGDRMKVTNWEKANDWVNGTYREGWELT